jgi:hypothetical protein
VASLKEDVTRIKSCLDSLALGKSSLHAYVRCARRHSPFRTTRTHHTTRHTPHRTRASNT